MAKKKNYWHKGMEVYLLNSDVGNERKINFREKYTIRGIGRKQAILDPISNENAGVFNYRRGFSLFLYSKEVAEDHNRNGYLHYAWDWSQLIVPAGKEGWDSDINILN